MAVVLLKISLFALVLPLVLGGTCDDYWTLFNGHCYRLYKESVSWRTARTHCEQQHAYLVSIESNQENDFVSYLSACSSDSATGSRTWIGLGPNYHSQSPKRWLDGNTMIYQRWRDREPNNGGRNEGCIETNRSARGEWNDTECYNQRQYMCEKSQRDN